MSADERPTPEMEYAAQNTDTELWRAPPGEYYADSVHITEGGGLGINCGGLVIVRPLRDWHSLERRLAEAEEQLAAKIKMAPVVSRLTVAIIDNYQAELAALRTKLAETERRAADWIVEIEGLQGTVQQLCDRFGIADDTFRRRLKLGWTLADALFVKVGTRTRWSKF